MKEFNEVELQYAVAILDGSKKTVMNMDKRDHQIVVLCACMFLRFIKHIVYDYLLSI